MCHSVLSQWWESEPGHPGALEQCLSEGDCQPKWPLNEALCSRGQRGGKTGSCCLHNKLFHNSHHLTSGAGVNIQGVWVCVLLFVYAAFTSCVSMSSCIKCQLEVMPYKWMHLSTVSCYCHKAKILHNPECVNKHR